MTLLGFLSLQMDLITANDLYLPDPSSDSDYEVVTANAVIVSGSISSVNKLGESVSTIEDLKPLYVSKELQVMNELFRPYSSLAHKDAKDYISIKSQGLTYRFASHDKSGGIFFRNSNSGLVLNTSDKPLAIRSRGSIILQSQINANKLPQIGNLQNPNWGFIDFPSGNSAVKMDSQKVVIPELLLGSRDWRIGKPSDKYGIELNIPNSFNNGFIIENENIKLSSRIQKDDKISELFYNFK